jgi:hypothetical protein
VWTKVSHFICSTLNQQNYSQTTTRSWRWGETSMNRGSITCRWGETCINRGSRSCRWGETSTNRGSRSWLVIIRFLWIAGMRTSWGCTILAYFWSTMRAPGRWSFVISVLSWWTRSGPSSSWRISFCHWFQSVNQLLCLFHTFSMSLLDFFFLF